jgi:NAD(P)H-dependent FMN reductase
MENQVKSGDAPVLVAAICGSLRQQSYTRMALRLALRGAAERGAQTRLIDLRDYSLVFCDGRDGVYPESVGQLQRVVQEADGIILGTPDYHGGFSGVLKNALDLMGFDEFEGKMIGLVGVSGGQMGAFEAINGLRNIGRALHAWVIPDQIVVAEAWRLFDEQGELKDKKLQERVLKVGREVARFARLHKCGQLHEFVEGWQGAPENPGG